MVEQVFSIQNYKFLCCAKSPDFERVNRIISFKLASKSGDLQSFSRLFKLKTNQSLQQYRVQFN